MSANEVPQLFGAHSALHTSVSFSLGALKAWFPWARFILLAHGKLLSASILLVSSSTPWNHNLPRYYHYIHQRPLTYILNLCSLSSTLWLQVLYGMGAHCLVPSLGSLFHWLKLFIYCSAGQKQRIQGSGSTLTVTKGVGGWRRASGPTYHLPTQISFGVSLRTNSININPHWHWSYYFYFHWSSTGHTPSIIHPAHLSRSC
jgi:hypothetical protein